MKRKLVQKTVQEVYRKNGLDSQMWYLIFSFLPLDLKSFVSLCHVQKAWTFQKYARLLNVKIWSWDVPHIASWTNLRKLIVYFDTCDTDLNESAIDCLKQYDWIRSVEIRLMVWIDFKSQKNLKLDKLTNLDTLAFVRDVSFTLLQDYLKSMQHLKHLKLDSSVLTYQPEDAADFVATMKLSHPSLKISFE